MLSKKVNDGIAQLLDRVKVATTSTEVDALIKEAHAWVSFAEIEEKTSRITRSEGRKISDWIDQVGLHRTIQLANS
ncbi:hypothetical protein GHO41_11700 [Pseudomonas sp. FSL R10-0399]|uniref:hypothetical protein n=1 Tax=Pseudomonas sp. FSL R10-0399 TaxID=2662194 RepID=UPI00129526CC|nr:hypothetical protein [Pseudomonas sp. FSL R10-0399]MQT58006.1 hypothetical protein [Pseudomonas sp. FSL R10-0399]